MKVSTKQVILSCEHGGNRIPAAWRELFAGAEAVLDSHRGWDPGALECARRLAAELDRPLISSSTSRLLVELNRSLHHRQLFSEYTRSLPEAARQSIINKHYLPYRDRLQQEIGRLIKRRGFALHLSIHTFTPVLNKEVRNADIGLLYDPQYRYERIFALRLRDSLYDHEDGLKVRRNYPYRGNADGVTTYLRKQYPASHYAGLELEINQRYPLGGDRHAWRRLQHTVAQAVIQTLNNFDI